MVTFLLWVIALLPTYLLLWLEVDFQTALKSVSKLFSLLLIFTVLACWTIVFTAEPLFGYGIQIWVSRDRQLAKISTGWVFGKFERVVAIGSVTEFIVFTGRPKIFYSIVGVVDQKKRVHLSTVHVFSKSTADAMAGALNAVLRERSPKE